MKYCSQCGTPVSSKIPEGDNLPRFICDNCHTIHYQNPKIVTGCLPEWKDRILLCKRAIEPRYGLWTLPAGFMENHETLTQAAERETWEEACAKVDNLQLYTVISLPYISQVYIMFRARLIDLDFAPGSESLDVKLFHPENIPWDELAFPVIRRTLTHYCEDLATHQFPLHISDILRRPSETQGK
jgi:ADP-ribose pyrophosphatase YjhB (NUDIX family)